MKQISAAAFAEAGFPLIGTPYKVLDCQAFWEKCRELCGDYINKKGSNAWYRAMTWVGSPEECIKKFGSIPKGATLFIHAFDGGEEKVGYHDGKGNASHIGIKTGRGKGAIHSGESAGGVAESNFKDKTIRNGGWNCVGLWAEGFDYGEKINALLRGETPSEDTPVTPDVPDTPEPDDDPQEEPVRQYAKVVSGNGKPVNTRRGPDETYAQSKAGKIPVGTSVEIIQHQINSQGEAWSRVKLVDQRGALWYCWIKDDFLEIDSSMVPQDDPDEDPFDIEFCCIEIRNIPVEAAKALKQQYPQAVISYG